MFIWVPSSLNSTFGIKTKGKIYGGDENIKLFVGLDCNVSRDKKERGLGTKSVEL